MSKDNIAKINIKENVIDERRKEVKLKIQIKDKVYKNTFYSRHVLDSHRTKIIAFIDALELILNKTKVRKFSLYTDDAFLYNLLAGDLLYKYKQNHWFDYNGKRLSNKSLYEYLLKLLGYFYIEEVLYIKSKQEKGC